MQVLPFRIFGSGVSAGVCQVEREVLEEINFSAQWLKQVHGTTIVEVEKIGPPVTGDALITREHGLRLLIRTADCIPVLLADEEAGLVAAVHAGWRGLTADIVPLTVERLILMGARPERLVVGIGPSLGVECALFTEPETEIPRQYQWAVRPDRHVDLWSILERQLLGQGIARDRVEWMNVCTACSPEWFSWRRDKTMARFGSFIELL